MSLLHYILVTPVGLFFVWPFFFWTWHKRERWGLHAAFWPRYVVTVWYIHCHCNLTWCSIDGRFTKPFSISFSLIILMKAPSSLSCHWKRELGNKVLIWGWALYQKHVFKTARVFYQNVRHVMCFVDCSIWSPVCININANICFFVILSSRILRSQWDVRALEAGLTEGAWWNTNPSRSMSASCVCHVSLGSTVAAGNAINVPMMTPPRWEGVETPFVDELYQNSCTSGCQ